MNAPSQLIPSLGAGGVMRKNVGKPNDHRGSISRERGATFDAYPALRETLATREKDCRNGFVIRWVSFAPTESRLERIKFLE
jgi:hypothetical protein